jgi:cob(I)alamin adenosyltransferase
MGQVGTVTRADSVWFALAMVSIGLALCLMGQRFSAPTPGHSQVVEKGGLKDLRIELDSWDGMHEDAPRAIRGCECDACRMWREARAFRRRLEAN